MQNQENILSVKTKKKEGIRCIIRMKRPGDKVVSTDAPNKYQFWKIPCRSELWEDIRTRHWNTPRSWCVRKLSWNKHSIIFSKSISNLIHCLCVGHHCSKVTLSKRKRIRIAIQSFVNEIILFYQVPSLTPLYW